MSDTKVHTHALNAAVLVAALGYFVDVYDLILFSVVRVQSLTSLGLSGEQLIDSGVFLLNSQMLGMLAGGILWGIWGDKRGRVSVLFGSITLYSIANIFNGLVTDVETYALLRFLAGLGLAGELGAGITLVTECMSKESRGWGTTIVAGVGVAGAIVAGLVADLFDWRTSYFVGGGMGVVLLVLRVLVHESGMFRAAAAKNVARGDLTLLFRSPERLLRYLSCIVVGMPIWYVVGILITFSPEIGRDLGMQQLPVAGRAVIYSYIGLVLGDFASGALSQILKTRKKVIALFIMLVTVSTVAYCTAYEASLTYLYVLAGVCGFGAGYWAVFVTTAAEQFGTNLRATVTTTTPNFVRGATVLLTFAFNYLRPGTGVLNAALIVGLSAILLSVIALINLRESYGNDLDYVET